MTNNSLVTTIAQHYQDSQARGGLGVGRRPSASVAESMRKSINLRSSIGSGGSSIGSYYNQGANIQTQQLGAQVAKKVTTNSQATDIEEFLMTFDQNHPLNEQGLS